MAPGSRKDHGFFAVPANSLDTIVLCESAIDAISCHALHPHSRCLSTAGARPNPAWLAELVAQSQQLYCGFDLDDTGEAMASSMMALHPSTTLVSMIGGLFTARRGNDPGSGLECSLR